jgi:hypothetical protein
MGARDATILEHNVVQTAGSAGESIAFGVGVTMPAILILGFDLEITRVMLVAILGGLLGILMMIPLRRALIVAQHGVLKYPRERLARKYSRQVHLLNREPQRQPKQSESRKSLVPARARRRSSPASESDSSTRLQ